MPVELFAQQTRVDGRPLRPERRAEASRERRLRLGDAELGAGELRRVAGEEEEERLLTAELRDRRQDPEGVGGEEDHRARVAGALRRQRVRDLLELVRGAGVLGLGVVVEVEDAALVDDDVLEHRAEACALPDLGLGLGREADRLRVAAALEVEDAVVAPAVLVVADQQPLGSAESVVLPVPERPKKTATSCRPARRSPSSAWASRPRAAAGRSSA